MTNQATVKIDGMITQRYKPGKAGKYVVHDFVVKTGNGDVKVRKFFDFDNTLIGKRVSLEASVSTYEGKEYYTVAKGTNIEVTESTAVAVETPQVAPETTTRVRKQQEVTATPVSNGEVADEVEGVRSAVEGIITKDVEFCTSLLGGKASKDAVAQLVSAFQATRATLVIQASNKRRGW